MRTFLMLLALTTLLCNSTSGQFLSYEKLSEKGREELIHDWTFQVKNRFNAPAVQQEITLAREVASRISKMEKAPDLKIQLSRLDVLETQIKACKDLKALYFEVRKVKREIIFSNPLIDFKQILLVDNEFPNGMRGDATNEWMHEARHRNGFMGVDGGKLLIIGLNPDDVKKNIIEGKEGALWRPDLSYDAKEVVFSFKPKGEKSFHLYKVNIDGTNFRQLTYGDYDDLDPVYTPDGHLIFPSSRQHSYVRCMPMTHAFAMTRCDADGKNIYIISANGEPEYMPSILPDGRVLFTRWEYTDKALWRVQSLWTMNPDGTNVQVLWGNQSVWPDCLTEARAIPGSRKIVFTAVGHHAWFDGTLGYIDPIKGMNYPDGLEWITRENRWPEVGGGPKDPQPSYPYNAYAAYRAYKSPYPLSEEYMLVSASRNGCSRRDRDAHFHLFFMDVYGNKELIYEGDTNAWYAVPLKERNMPEIKPDHVNWPPIGKGVQPSPGYFYSNNVYENAPEILCEKGKTIRVVQMDPKTYTTWYKTVQHDGPAVSVTQAEGVKRILGTIPIEEDGSIFFELPAGKSVYFEMLDENGMCIHVMRSFANVMPGEVRGCFGCHESKLKTLGSQPVRGMNLAMRKGARKLTPPSWGSEESIGYERFVQRPVLDKYCAGCHQKKGEKAYETLNMTSRPSVHEFSAWVNARPHEVSPFSEPYLTLVSGNCPWGGPKPRDERNVPANLAGVLVVEGYDRCDPANLATLPPYSVYSPVSRLVHNAISGEHHGMKVTGVDRERLIAWVDCNGPYLGDEEIRSMYDPVGYAIENIPPVRPRIATAPVINRFDINQEGDSNKVSGPLKLYDKVTRRPCAYDSFQSDRDGHMANEPADFKILDAYWGYTGWGFNVKEEVCALSTGKRFIDCGIYEKTFGCKRIANLSNSLNVQVQYNTGEIREYIFTENSDVIIPPLSSSKSRFMGVNLSEYKPYSARRHHPFIHNLKGTDHRICDFKVINATYGVDGKMRDVTEKLKNLLNGDNKFGRPYNALFGDPAPNQVKKLVIKVKYNSGEEKVFTFSENEQFSIPAVNQKK